MVGYTAPLQAIEFALREIADVDALGRLDGFAEAGLDSMPEILAEAGRLFSEVVAPTNRVGDVYGSRLDGEGGVVTPEGFAAAYARLVDGGWAGLAADPEYGGGGLPLVVATAVLEMLTSANMALALNPVLTQAAVHALTLHGSEEQKATWLPRLVTGEWSGTMVLTEPHAGSDVGALTTRAEPADDGTYRLRGQKIYITWGDHDLTENLVHLVVARTPGAPAGTRGISLFLVPKFLVEADGDLGARNDVSVSSLEHKMGLHGSPTCVLDFGDNEGAVGYLIGDEHAGMSYMFAMMNHARLSVAVQGLSVAERAYQAASEHAKERRQGRRPDTPPLESARIVEHPDVRRMLMTMRSRIEALRCIVYLNAASIDLASHADDEDERTRAGELAGLLTPVSKAWGTDIGVEVANTALQVFGGMGYIEETGIAQLVRDVRIATIYEGTNGIQAIDLVRRKLPMREGQAVMDLLARMGETAEALRRVGLTETGDRLERAVADLWAATSWLLQRGEQCGDDVLAGATPYLEMMGTTIGAWLLGRSALAATRRLEGDEAGSRFLESRIASARFFSTQLLPRVHALLPAVTAGADQLFSVDESEL